MAALIGELFVAVRPETSGFEKDLQAKLAGVGAGASASSAQGILSKVGEGLAVGIVAAVGASIALAAKFQGVVADIATSADISVKAAQKIGDAFLTTAGSSIFSANQLGEAYAKVAGQLGLLQGHALSAKQALDFMKLTSDLAEASGESLSDVTSSLANVMQSFQVPLKGAAGAANELFNASRVLDVPISSVANVIDRLHSRLGVAAPTVQQMSGLLVDLGEHGISGSRGLLVVNSAFNTLLNSVQGTSDAVGKSVNAAQTSVTSASAGLLAAQQRLTIVQNNLGAATKPTIAQQQQLATATNAVTEAQQRLAASADPTISQQQAVTNAQQNLANLQQRIAAQANLSVSQQGQLQAAQEAVTAATLKHSQAVTTLQQAQSGLSPTLSTSVAGAEQLGLTVFDTAGKFVGFRDILGQLQPKLKDMTEQQQLQALASVFGKNANKALLDTVLAGPAAFDKATNAVAKFTVAQAAAKQLDTLRHQLDVLRASFTDIGIEVGEKFLPIIESIGKTFARVIEFFLHNREALIALGVVFGAFATVTLTAFALSLKDKLEANLLRVGRAFGILGDGAAETKAPLEAEENQFAMLDAAIGRVTKSLGFATTVSEDAFVPIERLSGGVEGLQLAFVNLSTQGTAAYTDAAGRWRNAAGQFVSASDAVKLNLDEEWETASKLPPVYEQIGLSLDSLTDAFEPVTLGFDDLVDVEQSARVNALLAVEANSALAGSLDALGDAAAAAGPEIEAAGEEAGAGFDAALGPIGIALLGLTLLLPLVLKHWKEIWKDMRDVAEDAWHFLDHVFDEIKDVITKHLKEIAVAFFLLDPPLALLILGIVELAKHWKTVWATITEATHVAAAVLKGDFADILKIEGDAFKNIERSVSDVGSFFARIGKDIAKPFMDAFDGFSKWWKGYWPEIDEVLSTAFAIIGDIFETAFGLITTYVETGFEVIATIFRTAFDVISDVVKVGLDAVETYIRIIWPLFSGIFRAGLDVIIGILRAGLTVVETVFRVAFGAITVVVRSVWDIVAGWTKAAFAVIRGIFEVGLDLLTGHWSKAWHDLTKTVDTVGKDILGAVRSVFANLLGYIGGTVVTVYEATVKVGKQLIGGIWDGIQTAWGALVGFFTGIPGKLEAFFKDAAKWLLSAGKSLIDGLIKGAVDAPIDGLKKVGDKVIKGFKSIFHVFSPSTDTQPIGKGLFDGLTKGFEDSSADLSTFERVALKIKACLQSLEAEAYTCGKQLMSMLAKGITEGASLVTAAVDKISIKLGTSAGGAAGSAHGTGGKGGLELKQELLEVARLSDQRLATSTVLLAQLEAIAARDFARMIDELVLVPVLLRSVGDSLTERIQRGDDVVLQQLSMERLQLVETRNQTVLLRQILQQLEKPQTIALKKPTTPGPSSSTAGNAASALVSGLLS